MLHSHWVLSTCFCGLLIPSFHHPHFTISSVNFKNIVLLHSKAQERQSIKPSTHLNFFIYRSMQSPEHSRTRTRFLAALGRLSTRSKSPTGDEGSADDTAEPVRTPLSLPPIVTSKPPYDHSSPTSPVNEIQSSSSQTSSPNIRGRSFCSESTIPQKLPTAQRRAHPRSISLSKLKRPARLRSDTHLHQHYVRRAHHVEDDQVSQTNFINPFLAGPLELPMRFELSVSPTDNTPQMMPEASPHLERRRRAMTTALRLPKMMFPKTRSTQASSSSGGSCDHSQTTTSPKSSPAINEATDIPESVAFPMYITKIPLTGGQGMQSPALGRGIDPEAFPFPNIVDLCDHVQGTLGDGESMFHAQDSISNSSQRDTNSWSTTSMNALEFSAKSDVYLDGINSTPYSEVTTSNTESPTFHAYSDNTPIAYISPGRQFPRNRGPGIRLWATLSSHAELCDYYQTVSDDDGSVLDADGYIPSISADDQSTSDLHLANSSRQTLVQHKS